MDRQGIPARTVDAKYPCSLLVRGIHFCNFGLCVSALPVSSSPRGFDHTTDTTSQPNGFPLHPTCVLLHLCVVPLLRRDLIPQAPQRTQFNCLGPQLSILLCKEKEEMRAGRRRAGQEEAAEEKDEEEEKVVGCMCVPIDVCALSVTTCVVFLGSRTHACVTRTDACLVCIDGCALSVTTGEQLQNQGSFVLCLVSCVTQSRTHVPCSLAHELMCLASLSHELMCLVPWRTNSCVLFRGARIHACLASRAHGASRR